MLVGPQDYWALNCWSCREEGHTTFTCKYLTPSQRIYFAYAYYPHQIQGNPAMRKWYNQRARQARDEDINPGPKPSNAGARGMGLVRGGRGGGRLGRGNGRPGGPQRREHPKETMEEQPAPSAVKIIMDDKGEDSSSSSENDPGRM